MTDERIATTSELGLLGVRDVDFALERFPPRGEGRVRGQVPAGGGFLPFLDAPVSDLTDLTLPAERLWGPAAGVLAEAMATACGADELIALAEGFLRGRWPPPDPQVELVGAIVAALLHDRTITRVEDVSRRFGLPARTLQRLFRRYVGVSPKWVLRRYRLHEAAAALARERERPWAESRPSSGTSTSRTSSATSRPRSG